jgi:hypothetical protein
MGLLAYEPARLHDLRLALSHALSDLRTIRCDDPDARQAMRAVVEGCRLLDERCLPAVQRVLDSTAMKAPDSYFFGSCDVRSSAVVRLARQRQWLLYDDPDELGATESLVPPPPVRGPAAAVLHSYDDVMKARECGEIQPLQLPGDPHRPSASQYSTVMIAPGGVAALGEHEITRSIARFIGFWSDALPVGYHEHKVRSVYRVSDAHVVTSLHAVEADGSDHPILLGEATVSGYLVVVDLAKGVDVNISMGQADPTQSVAIPAFTDHDYAATFYPDEQPQFRPATLDSALTPPTWTLTTHPLHAAGDIGTWGGNST